MAAGRRPILKPRWPLRPASRHNPAELFLWRVPFQPVLRVALGAADWLLEPGIPDGERDAGVPPMKKAIFLGVNLLGDLLCTTPAIRAFRRRHPDTHVTYIVQNAAYCRVLDGNPDVDLVLYSERLYLEGEGIFCDAWLRSLPLDLQERSVLYRFNIHEACRTSPAVFDDHIAVAFGNFVGIPVDSVRPVVCLSEEERRTAAVYARGKPYVVFSMHSTSKVVDPDGRIADKSWPVERWLRLAREIRASGFDVIAVGAETDSATLSPDIRNLYGLPIKTVAALLEKAACVVAVESGVTHLCHAVDAATVVIFSKHIPLAWANPREASRAILLYEDPAAISCDDVMAAVQATLARPAGAPEVRAAGAVST